MFHTYPTFQQPGSTVNYFSRLFRPENLKILTSWKMVKLEEFGDGWWFIIQGPNEHFEA